MIVITYGNDIVKNAYDTLAASDIGLYLRAEFSVSIKPNLGSNYSSPCLGAYPPVLA